MGILKRKTTASILAGFQRTVHELKAVAEREGARALTIQHQMDDLVELRLDAETEQRAALAAAAKIGALLE